MVGVLGSVPTPMVFFFPDCPSIAPDPVSPNPYLLRACMLHAPACLALLARALFFSSSPSIFDHVFTFSRLEKWVNVLRLSPPATDTQRGLRSERGTPRSAPMHYLRTHA